MRQWIIWAGVFLVAAGVVLPWAAFDASVGGRPFASGTLPGFEYVQSLVSLAISVLGVLVARRLSGGFKKFALALSGFMVLALCSWAWSDPGKPELNLLPPGTVYNMPDGDRRAQNTLSDSDLNTRIAVKPQFGLYVSMAGGVLLLLGGLTGKQD